MLTHARPESAHSVRPQVVAPSRPATVCLKMTDLLPLGARDGPYCRSRPGQTFVADAIQPIFRKARPSNRVEPLPVADHRLLLSILCIADRPEHPVAVADNCRPMDLQMLAIESCLPHVFLSERPFAQRSVFAGGLPRD